MRIAVMGAGGIGGFYGALLVRAGHEVTLIARGAHLAAIREHGLTLIDDRETFTVRPALATADTAEAGREGPAELVLVTTKAYDLDAAARALLPLVGQETLVLPLLNGVGIHQRLSGV
ncbi:MAG: 2-dehydropantoate 2-reductase, partial [bacterium]